MQNAYALTTLCTVSSGVCGSTYAKRVCLMEVAPEPCDMKARGWYDTQDRCTKGTTTKGDLAKTPFEGLFLGQAYAGGEHRDDPARQLSSIWSCRPSRQGPECSQAGSSSSKTESTPMKPASFADSAKACTRSAHRPAESQTQINDGEQSEELSGNELKHRH